MAHVGSGGSRLARARPSWVSRRLGAAIPDRRWLEVLISTTGDQNGSVALGTGVFVKEIEQALLDGAVDVAVHSLKDLPTDPTPGLTIAAIPQRTDPRDCLVGARLEDLPDGARVGTGSPRRASQLRPLRPGLQVVAIRGNVPTRVDKGRSGQVEAAMVAGEVGALGGGLAERLADVGAMDLLPEITSEAALEAPDKPDKRDNKIAPRGAPQGAG